MSCNITLEKLSEMMLTVDGTDSRLQDHVGQCTECQNNIRLLGLTDETIRSSIAEEPPEDIWQKVSSRIEARQPAARPRPNRRIFAYGLMTLLVAIAVILQIKPNQPGALPDPDFEAFYRQHSALSSVEASAVLQTPQVKQFEADAQITVHFPRTLPSGWKLAALDRFTCKGGRPVAHLVYARDGKLISIFQKPIGGGPGFGMGRGRGAGSAPRQGQCRIGQSDIAFAAGHDHRFVAIGDLPLESLNDIVRELAAQK